MAEETFEEKTEKPTPKKREEARRKGEVGKSRELPSVSVLLAATITMAVMGSYLYSFMQTIIQGTWSLIPSRDLNMSDCIFLCQKMITQFILLIGPIFLAVFVTAILSNIMQVGFILAGEQIRPKLSKIDPIKGFGRLFSKNASMELLKSFLKLAIVGGIAYLSIRDEMKNLSFLVEMEVGPIMAYILSTSFKLFIKCAMAMIFLVILDYAFQKWDFEKRMRMSKKEIKEEFKKTEGDPQVKARIRGIQMQMARRRMMQAVPKADVVITNPTHLAVALRYDNSEMNAPKVIAKGAGEVAKRIKEIAATYHIPIVENKELAQALNAMVDIGQEIPRTLYQAVAEILAYIYKLKRKGASLGGQRP